MKIYLFFSYLQSFTTDTTIVYVVVLSMSHSFVAQKSYIVKRKARMKGMGATKYKVLLFESPHIKLLSIFIFQQLQFLRNFLAEINPQSTILNYYICCVKQIIQIEIFCISYVQYTFTLELLLLRDLPPKIQQPKIAVTKIQLSLQSV